MPTSPDRLEGLPVADDQMWLQVSGGIYIPLTVACMGWVAWSAGPAAVLARLVGERPMLWLVVGLGLGGGLAVASQRLTPGSERMQRMADALATQLGPMAPATTLALAALSAVGEEWCFRGMLQPALGWRIATVLFALVHLPTDKDLWLWPLLAGGIGVVLAKLSLWSGDGLIGPIALHFAINALNLRWLAHRAAAIRRGA